VTLTRRARAGWIRRRGVPVPAIAHLPVHRP